MDEYNDEYKSSQRTNDSKIKKKYLINMNKIMSPFFNIHDVLNYIFKNVIDNTLNFDMYLKNDNTSGGKNKKRKKYTKTKKSKTKKCKRKNKKEIQKRNTKKK